MDELETALLQEIAQYQSLTQLWDENCRHYADQPAFSNMGATLTYAELDRAANNLAAYLQNCTKLKPGDRFAIQLPNLLQYPVAMLAALRCGLVIVNTNPLYTAAETISQFQDAGVKGVIILANNARMLQDVIPETNLSTVIVTELADLHPFPRNLMLNFTARYVRKIVPRYRIRRSVKLNMALSKGAQFRFTPVTTHADSPALIQYTVGTTGGPKGVLLHHKNLITNAMQLKSRLPEALREGEEIAIAPLPLYHIYGFSLNCLVMPMIGAHLVLITNPRDTNGLINELGRWDFTVFSGINTLFVSLCQNPAFEQLDTTRLKMTLSGGMALTRSVSDEWLRITGCNIIQGYGLTEAAPVVAVGELTDDHFGSVGKPLPLTEVKVMGEQGSELCSGETGELYVRGPQVMQGYWGNKTEVIDDGWLATGDVVRIGEDGSIRIIDRKSDIINISGFPVYPNELENIITSHPDVIECAVIGLPDDDHGQVIKLFVVTANWRLSVKQVREYCRERLTSYKVPKLVEFRSHLPKSNVGKVIRRALYEEEIKRIKKQRKVTTDLL